MKYYLKKLSILYLVCAIFLLFTSCNKNNAIQPTNSTQNTTLDNGEKVPWVGIAIAAVVILINCTEGQYHHKLVIYPDGTEIEDEWCEGWWGHCTVRGAISNGTSFTSISSQQQNEDWDYDFIGNASLVKTDKGRVLLKISNNTDDINTYKNFFYDEEITISRPLTIDNVSVLDKLKHDKPITVQGNYKVYDDGDGKFIVLE